MFENAAKSGGVYFKGTWQGKRLALVKSSKTTADGTPIWSLLVDGVDAPDLERVYQSRADYDVGQVEAGPDGIQREARQTTRAEPWQEQERDYQIPF
jgi:hypothetical protein